MGWYSEDVVRPPPPLLFIYINPLYPLLSFGAHRVKDPPDPLSVRFLGDPTNAKGRRGTPLTLGNTP
jgi:hypothetical protein